MSSPLQSHYLRMLDVPLIWFKVWNWQNQLGLSNLLWPMRTSFRIGGIEIGDSSSSSVAVLPRRLGVRLGVRDDFTNYPIEISYFSNCLGGLPLRHINKINILA